MGMDPEARLAYGYDLGGPEDFRAKPRLHKLPWLDDEEGDFPEAAENILFESVGFTEQWSKRNEGYFDRKKAAEERIGVEIQYSGTYDYPGWILAAKGSRRSVEWAEAMELDPAEIAEPRTEWDAKLAAALTALGITPTQDGPRWLVFPFYG